MCRLRRLTFLAHPVSIWPKYSCARVLTYLLICTVGSGRIKPALSETVEDRAKVTINGLYKVVHGLMIAAKMYDLRWPLSEIQGHWFLKCRKMTKYSLTPTPRRVAGCIISIRPTFLRIQAPVHLLTYLLTYLHRITSVLCNWPSFPTFIEWFVFRSTVFGRPNNNKRRVSIVLFCGIARLALLYILRANCFNIGL